MDSIITKPDLDMLSVQKFVENTIWIYKSQGGWNNKEIIFNNKGEVWKEGKKMGYWGIQGRSLYFQVDSNDYRKESMVAIYISQTKIDWLKINFMENVSMIAQKED